MIYQTSNHFRFISNNIVLNFQHIFITKSQYLSNIEKDLLNIKHKKKKTINFNTSETNDLINEASSLYEEDEYQLSNDENADESDEDQDNMDHNTDDENSTDNDEDEDGEEENSTADSVSF